MEWWQSFAGAGTIFCLISAILFSGNGAALAHPAYPNGPCLSVFDVADSMDWAVKQLDEVSKEIVNFSDDVSKLDPDDLHQGLVLMYYKITVEQLRLIGSHLGKCRDALVRPE